MGRANGSRECAPDDKLRETHHSCADRFKAMDFAALYPSNKLAKKFLNQSQHFIRSVVLQPMAGAGDLGEFGVLEMRHHAGFLGIGQEAFAGRDQQRRARDA